MRHAELQIQIRDEAIEKLNKRNKKLKKLLLDSTKYLTTIPADDGLAKLLEKIEKAVTKQ